MAQPLPHTPVLLLLAAVSRYEEAVAWSREQAERAYGPVAVASEPFLFDDTDYYEPSMGSGLRKQFFVFERLIDPSSLAEIKLATNRWEANYQTAASHTEPRPLNLDPGYLSLSKLVLASAKDHAHRVYLRDGIYAEVTLHFRRKQGWQPLDWTFPDYRRDDYRTFFADCRELLKRQRRQLADGAELEGP